MQAVSRPTMAATKWWRSASGRCRCASPARCWCVCTLPLVMRLTGKRGVDVVFENVGPAAWGAALKSLVRGGRVVTCRATTGDHPGDDLRRVFIRQLQIFDSILGKLAQLRDLVRFCAQHNLRPVMDKIYALGEAHVALERLVNGEQFRIVAVRIGD